MAGPRLELPLLQNWSCHNCGGCCRQHAIEITDEERRRIERQGWTAADGIPSGQPVVERISGQRYRLAHQPDGACIFLDEQGLCRIHAKFGEKAKPLACRLYPYAFHPAGKKVALSLRFSCPSVVANRGTPVLKQSDELRRLAQEVVPQGAERIPPPSVSAGERLDWPDFLRIVEALDATFAEPEPPLLVRLLRALFWVNLVGQATFEKIKGPRVDELLGILRAAAIDEVPTDLPEISEPSRTGRTQFRLLVAQYARKDTFADVRSGWRGRWKLFRAAIGFTRGKGLVPPLQEVFQPVPFAALEAPFGGLPAGADELLTRYFRVKIQGLHFCGPAYYDQPLADGFQGLALMYPVTLWLARWLAASDGRTTLQLDDVARALAIADHHHGYSPALGQFHARRRVRILHQLGDIPRLCVWYSR